MREILFRGKRLDNGEWVCGYLYRLSERLNPFIMFVNSNAESHEVIPETVEQFTGLTDKNGKKIFEGDIIAYGDDRYLVNFGDGYFSPFDFICEDECKVIGNIYDNPELLGE